MPHLASHKDCTSCLACYNTCPFDAMSIGETGLSAKVPIIDDAKCRECGLCEKSCPIVSKPAFKYPKAAYALFTQNDEDRGTCTSGGAATAFSRQIIDDGGMVYSATSYGGYPKFIRIDNQQDLESLKGSKYVYCDPQQIYLSVLNDLKAGRSCLFIGLPCIVAALLKVLRRDVSYLITVDLVCHGTPPYEYLRQHIYNKIPKDATVGNLTFRGKLDFHTHVCGNLSETLYVKSQYEDEYLLGFMRGWIYRPSCYRCEFAQPQRCSDITIGDFWGLAPDALNGYFGKKSLALINTERGSEFFKLTTPRLVIEERTVEEAVSGNPQLRAPHPYTEAARIFHNVYSQTGSFQTAAKACGIKYCPPHNLGSPQMAAQSTS